MRLRLIWTIFRKDVLDAVRDGRILVPLLVPMGLGIFYGFLFNDETETTPTAVAAYVSPDETRLPDLLQGVVDDAVILEIKRVNTAEEVRRLVADDDADLGLTIPSGFDAAATSGAFPPLDVVLSTDRSYGGNLLAASLDDALRQMAGQPDPVEVRFDAVGPAVESGNVIGQVGPASYFVITSVIFQAVMIALFVVPALVTEELEKKTLDALVMVASYAEVVAAKALVGLVYTITSIGMVLAFTRTEIATPLVFGAAMLLLTVALIGFGLLMGGLFRTVSQLSSWSSVILLPVVAPVYATGQPVPDWANAILSALPTSQATRLTMNAVTGEQMFSSAWLSFVVIVAWAALACALLLWRLSRREG